MRQTNTPFVIPPEGPAYATRVGLPMSEIPSPQGSRFVYIAAAVAALGGILFGYDTGVISGAILFIKQDFRLSSTTQEIVVSSVLLGAVLGAAAGGAVADSFGRRKVIIVSAAIFGFGAIATALVPSVSWLIAGRVVVGIAIGVASFVAPLYIAEVAPVHVRGSLVSLNQLAITIGIVAAYLVDFALSGVHGWRWMFALAAIPAAILGIAMFALPDSPRWLLSRGMVRTARSALERIRGTRHIDDEFNDIRAGLSRQRGSFRDLSSPLVRPVLVVGIGLAVFQQATGINTVIYYAPTIFQSAGFAEASVAILATFGVGCVNVLMTVVAIVLVDRVGRRPLLLTGLAGMTFSLLVLGLTFKLGSQSASQGTLAMGCLMLYVGAFAVGLGPVFWLLISEIYPLRVRGIAMSIATVANWATNLVIALIFLTLVEALGRPETFWLFALVGVGGWLFVYRLVPETRGRTLEQIEAHWLAGGHPRGMGR